MVDWVPLKSSIKSTMKRIIDLRFPVFYLRGGGDMLLFILTFLLLPNGVIQPPGKTFQAPSKT